MLAKLARNLQQFVLGSKVQRGAVRREENGLLNERRKLGTFRFRIGLFAPHLLLAHGLRTPYDPGWIRTAGQRLAGMLGGAGSLCRGSCAPW